MSVNHRKPLLEVHAIEDRNALIVELRQAGQLLKTIAARVNLTETRVSQIYLEWLRAQPAGVVGTDCRRRPFPTPNRFRRAQVERSVKVDQP